MVARRGAIVCLTHLFAQTLLDSQLLAAIGPFELIGTAWTKVSGAAACACCLLTLFIAHLQPGKETNSKNLLALIHRFNVVSL